MNSISFSGLATGLDTSALIDAMVQAERIPIERLRVKQDNHDSMASRFGTIKDRLETLRTAMEAITKGSDTSSASSTSDKVGVTAIGQAEPGNYKIDVISLASVERTVSDGFADKTSSGAFVDGQSFDITVGTDAAVQIDVYASDSLEDIAKRINDSDARAHADIIYDGSTYRLQISGDDTGAANAISFTENTNGGTSFGLTNAANQIVAASDASFMVNDFLMSRTTNDVSEAIPGITLDLNAVTTDSVIVTVGADEESLSERLDAVVEAYNKVVNGINVESIYTGEARTGDSLTGDGTLRSLQQAMRSSLIGAIPNFNMMSEFGLETSRSGGIEFDKEAFASALNTDPDGVMEALTGDGTTQGLFERIDDMITRFTDETDGLISQRIKGFESENKKIDDRIASMELRIDKFEENLVNKFASLETLVAGLNAQGEQMLAILGSL